MFNTLFTSLVSLSVQELTSGLANGWQTIIFLGIFEQDLRASTLLAVPELYTKGQRSGGFNLKIYLGWMVRSINTTAFNDHSDMIT